VNCVTRFTYFIEVLSSDRSFLSRGAAHAVSARLYVMRRRNGRRYRQSTAGLELRITPDDKLH
jgi:hypothetical protein